MAICPGFRERLPSVAINPTTYAKSRVHSTPSPFDCFPGIGPRDLTQFNFNGTPGDALGGSMYWGASLEFQTPLYFLPKDAGVKFAVFADAGSLWDYKGPLSWDKTGEVISGSICNPVPAAGCPLDNAMHVRASLGAGILWASPFGPIRFDFAIPLLKEPYDRKQFFRFGGGTTF